MQPSHLLQSLSESETLAMAQRSQLLKSQGIEVISLSLGEPDFNTPDHIKMAACEAIDNNDSFYTPVPGYMSLRQAIVKKLEVENGLTFAPEQIVCSTGAKQALAQVLMAAVNKGDEVILPAPYWVSYIEMIKLAQGTPVIVDADIAHDFKITARQLEQAITPKTRALILCSPSNPTGSVYSHEELEALAAVLEKYPNILIVADEIYEHINYVGKHASIAAFEAVKERVVIVNGVSKGYAMTGWRLGWIAAPKWLAAACIKLQGQLTSNACSIAQRAAEAAYNGPQACVATMREAFRRRRDLVVRLAGEVPGFVANVPQGAFYLFPDCSALFGKKTADGKTINSSVDLSDYLLDEAHVATVAGAAFGAPKCIRLSYATADELLVKAFAQIKAAVEKLS